MSDTLSTKLGDTRSGPRTRIWLQGARLPEHGWHPGEKFRRVWGEGKLVLQHLTQSEYDATPRTERGTVSGNATRPVIDIVGARVSSTFKGSHVTAKFTAKLITITSGEG